MSGKVVSMTSKIKIDTLEAAIHRLEQVVKQAEQDK